MPPGILERLQSGLPVRIVAIGGSMTAGHACFDGDRNGRACAWPQRMQERLLQMFPDHSNITVANMATPGQDYTAALSSGRIRNMIDADVLLVDLQVNSQVSNPGPEAAEAAPKRRRLANQALSALPSLIDEGAAPR